jgi:DNA polymerase-3 subunit alpha|nr:MAG TPA: DNA polymerase III, alpha subunit [Caudoviricetes sp.]
MENYTILHLHTDLSTATTNIDSVTKSEDYIKRASELGMKAIAFTEHGNILNWAKKKENCEKYGLKYIHGIEAYLTETLDEKIRDNYHCCLYAKNYDGVKELNKLISKSFNRKDNHFYYTPRITLDELEQTSDNIIITSACLGGIFGKADKYIQDRYLKFFIKNKNRCYLEIQHHLDEKQVKLNQKLFKLAKENDLNLTVGTDTHALNEVHAKGRKILQQAKKINFSDEDKWDITFKTYDELIDMYQRQNAIPMNEVLKALENTNKIANSIETFDINREYKYPKLWDNPEELLKEKINKGIKEKGLNKLDNFETEYLPRIKEELKTYKHNKAIDFLLLDEDIKSYARQNNRLPGYSRGSVSGSLVAYIIGLTDMDSIKHKLNFQRFMNVERVSLADIDTDWDKDDRKFIKEYIYNKEGLYCADIITFNTVALKGSIRDVGRALEIPLSEINEICDNIENKEEEYRALYPQLFEYVDIINGTIVSVGTHPCGLVCSPEPLDENMGLMSLSTCDYPVTMLNMKEIDSQNYVKLDLLALDNITLINKTCELLGIKRLNPNNVPDDEKVWKSIRDNTLGIFQWEGTGENYIKDLFSDETIANVKKYNPNFKYIDLFSVGNGAIRPAGASYREQLSKGIFKDNGHKALNEFLSPTLGYLVYQEQIIEFLNKFCGFSMGEADIVRRGFAKKTGTEQYIPKIKEGFTKTMKDEYGLSEEESNKIIVDFLKVIYDASSYLFSLNHSQAYSYIGYICGYLRYYYPLEFLTTMFNIYEGDIDKTKKIVDYAEKLNINLKNPKFRYSKGEYFMDKETNSIYKGLSSIKFISKNAGEILYNLKDNQYDSFIDLLIDIGNKINSKNINILIRLDFFSTFGTIPKLLKVYELYQTFYGKKQISKEKYPNLNKIFTKFAIKESDKMFKFNNTLPMLKYMESKVKNKENNTAQLIQDYFEFTGSCDIKDKSFGNKYLVVDIDTKYAPKITLYSLSKGKSTTIKIYKKHFKLNPLKVGDVIGIKDAQWKHRKKMVDDKWIKLEEKELIVESYKIY